VHDFPAFIVVDDKGNDFFQLVDRPLDGAPVTLR
jgi:tartrate dehydratase beta subunit/fumarate hydratase class I family protein